MKKQSTGHLIFGIILGLFLAIPLALPEQKPPATGGSQAQEPPSSFYNRGTKRSPFLQPFTVSYTEAPKVRPPVSDESGGLRVIGILRSPSGLNKAIINDRTLTEGKSGQFNLDGRLVDVKLVRVGANEVTVQLDGNLTLIIKLQESGAPAPADHSKEKP